MTRPKNIKVGDQFRVAREHHRFHVGEIVTLKEDDGTDYPYFWKEDKSDWHPIYFSKLEPLTKTIRDAQVGDVVVDKNDGSEKMVLERGQSTVLLSYGNRFKKIGNTMVFDELEKHFTLKDAPEVEETTLTMDEIALKFGVDVSKLRIKTEQQEKRFDDEFLDSDGEYCIPIEKPYIQQHVEKLKQFIADEIAVAERRAVDEFVRLYEKI